MKSKDIEEKQAVSRLDRFFEWLNDNILWYVIYYIVAGTAWLLLCTWLIPLFFRITLENDMAHETLETVCGLVSSFGIIGLVVAITMIAYRIVRVLLSNMFPNSDM